MQLQNLLLLSAVAGLPAAVDAWSPSNSYAPGNVSCPANANFVRAGGKLSDEEIDWLAKREVYTTESLKDFMTRAMANFTDSSILDQLFGSSNSSNVPKIAVAASGGGYRAMLSGAGMISAMDNRTVGANEHGLGGLLQSTTYLAGLSGGNWLVGTLAWNNWTSVQDIVNNFTKDDSIWDISNSIFTPGGLDIAKTVLRWNHISDAVKDKQEAGFNVSLTDIWGRALSYGFFPSLKRGGEAYTWSTLREAQVFQDGAMPFPISVADGRYPGSYIINLNATLFEFNPFEMGSWDPTLNAFSDVKYLGTNVTNGTPVNTDVCVEGYDNTGFIMGTSSSLFNQFLLRLNTTGLNSFIQDIVRHYLVDLSNESDDIAIYAPNPFKNTNHIKSNYSQVLSETDYLFLVDGGEDQQNIPLVPLLQKERDIDVIFALDNSADTNNSWPNGASLVNTYQRQFESQGVNIAFPYVPDTNSFVNLGLNRKPTFFGCEASNMTSLRQTPPLVVYIPNSKYSYASNQSTFKMSYSKKERIGMIQNGFEAATRGNFTYDPEFIGCVACAILKRKQESLNATLPAECEACLTTYCWNGTISNDPNSADEIDNGEPDTILSTTSSKKSGKTSTSKSSKSSKTTSTDNSKSGSSDSTKSGSVHVVSPYDFTTILTFILGVSVISFYI
ncbi:hypothetical protein Kpol_1037p12 [Vanderwaltozyma polyspora DSM 70294]|uniref:Lysophospholipase n=1 Tax=Vanderwaltozyma polyspora (strain ATCC 22028 / DSM 70294 / BCRC 21397 / CBS 2163 / NBRC 10782 / NRRL Y-8283 / UCD 57-17) TaxID=436907 RepID=A7TJV4_VANPO|nr:uncharacterized protein Kpol_1037p12 [Vanderwaltozyma polyspora DSM 70294]EDO17416.1 hypothetical protein Kpol_1037p12 [Vanderwaltozyma polyspora DSM 70294]